MEWQIPLADVDFGPEEALAVQEVLESRWLTMGAVTQTFEDQFKDYCGAKYALAVANCTAALHLACLAVGIKPGEEVIVPSLTFVATANAVRYVGAKPVFADVTGEDDLTISPKSIKRQLTEKTSAIIVMHYGGVPCDMPEIMEFAKEHNLKVIEDDAHAVGSSLDNRMMGVWGDIGCFSFFSNKNMTTGEGGMIVTNDDEIYNKVRLLRSHGMTSLTWDRHQGHAWSYDVVDLGYNYRIDEIRSAIGLIQLRKLDRNNEKRRALTELYIHLLDEYCPQMGIPFRNHRGISACHIMPVLLPPDCNRRIFMDNMKGSGIQTSIHYPPIHKFTNYAQTSPDLGNELVITDNIAMREVTLPMYPMLTEKDILYIVQTAQTSMTIAQMKTNKTMDIQEA